MVPEHAAGLRFGGPVIGAHDDDVGVLVREAGAHLLEQPCVGHRASHSHPSGRGGWKTVNQCPVHRCCPFPPPKTDAGKRRSTAADSKPRPHNPRVPEWVGPGRALGTQSSCPARSRRRTRPRPGSRWQHRGMTRWVQSSQRGLGCMCHVTVSNAGHGRHGARGNGWPVSSLGNIRPSPPRHGIETRGGVRSQLQGIWPDSFQTTRSTFRGIRKKI